MGVRGLYKLLRRSGYVPRSVTEFTGCRLAVDTKALMYRYMQAAEPGESLVEPVVQRIDSFVQKLSNLGAVSVTLVCDGQTTPVEKSGVTDTRKRVREARASSCVLPRPDGLSCNARLQRAAIRARCSRLARANRALCTEDVCGILHGLTHLGHDVFRAQEEADFALAWLSTAGVVDYVVGDDSDLLVSCRCVVRGLPDYVRSGSVCTPPRVYSRSDIVGQLGLTMAEFAQLACLLGCDYNHPIPGIGPVRALSTVQTWKTVAAYLDHTTRSHTFPGGCTTQEYVRKIQRSTYLLTAYRPDQDALARQYSTKKARTD